MSIFLIYLFTRLPFIIGIAKAFAIISAILTAMGAAFYAESFNGGEAEKRFMKKCFITFLCSIAVIGIVPSQKDAAIILAGYGVIEAAQSETAKRIAGKSVDLIEQTLDSYLKETIKEK